MARRNKPLHPNQALHHPDHRRPLTRREFIAQGFMSGTGVVLGGSLLNLLASPNKAMAELSADLELQKTICGIVKSQQDMKIPFICFDLAGGANISGSNVLVGGRGGQRDFLSTAGYSKLGLPGDMTPSSIDPGTNLEHINEDFGLAFHSKSAMLRGMQNSAGSETASRVNGTVIPARSDNDTGNNPHNPMYGIQQAGADGALLTLVGSRSTDSGGNSMAPSSMIDLTVRPTKVDRPSDVVGLVDVGDLEASGISQQDAVAVMESIQRISDHKLNAVDMKVSNDAELEEMVRCSYVKSADLADRYGNPAALNPELDTDIVGAGGIFTAEEFANDSEFRKTASVMKLVVEGEAGAGTITMGGYDYHTGDRSTGELRDERAGRCIGACLEYAARKGKPLMIYVFSDGSVASNGMTDDSVDGGGKGVWTGDNSSTASSFFLVYNPVGRPVAVRNQIGHMRSDASVETSSSPAANNVNLLVETVVLNYMALHNNMAGFDSTFTRHGLGNAELMDSLVGLEPIISG